MPVFYAAVDLAKNEIRNVVAQNLGSAPSSPVKGQFYFDSTNNILKWFDGGSWIAAMGGAGAVPSDSPSTQAIGDAAAGGASTLYSRGDHKHGLPNFGTISSETAFNIAKADGSATTIARSDHTHGTPALSNVTPTTQVVGDTAAAGSGLSPSRDDHKHGTPGFGAATSENTTFGVAGANGSAATVARSDHTHGNPAHGSTAHNTLLLNTFQPPSGQVDMGSQKIINLADPTNAQDGATKNYVDNGINGLSWKDSVRAASTANIASLSGTPTVDGVALVALDRVLVKNQTTASANGIYVVNAGAWTRATDADSATDLDGLAVFVNEGTANADTAWVCTTNAPVTVGTTSLVFTQFGAGATYVGGAGLTLTANTFDVVAGDTSLVVNADELHVNTAVMATVASVNTAVTGMVKKYAAALTGTASPEVVTHGLNTRDVTVTVLNGSSPYTAVEVDWDATSTTTVTLRYNPNLGAGYRVVIVG